MSMNERAPVHQCGINMGFIYVSPAVKERENRQTAAEQKPESLCFLFYFHKNERKNNERTRERKNKKEIQNIQEIQKEE